MFDIRDMELLAALAEHRHFARAAEACGISQPAFSARIRNLEHELKAPIVRRGNRFMGFTEEGEIALRWAHRFLADADGLVQEIGSARSELTGSLVIGAVPTAIGFAAQIPARLVREHPNLQLQLRSAPSSLIRRGLEDGTIDAGVTYLDTEFPSNVITRHLYNESYILVAPPELAPRPNGMATWAEAAKLPLCLLTRDMRNRRILDEVFDGVGAAIKPVLETNTLTAALAQVTSGSAATIVPASFAATQAGQTPGAAILTLIEPDVTKAIGLITARRDPQLPAVTALLALIKTL